MQIRFNVVLLYIANTLSHYRMSQYFTSLVCFIFDPQSDETAQTYMKLKFKITALKIINNQIIYFFLKAKV